MAKRKQRASHRYTDPVLLSMVPDFQRPVIETLSSREIKEMMVRHLDELPDRQRLPVTFHYLHGMSHQQISEALGRPRLAITRDIERGVSALRAKMEASGVKDAVMVLSLVLTGAQLVSPPASAAAPVLAALSATAPVGGGVGGAAAAALAVAKSKVGIAAAAVCLLVGGALVLSANRRHDPQPAGGSAVTVASLGSRGQTVAPLAPPVTKSPVSRAIPSPQPAGIPSSAVAAGAVSQAAGSVTGRVISQYDKAPLPGVAVSLTANPKGAGAVTKSAVSASDGLFVFPDTPAGAVTISVEPAQPWLAQQRRTLVSKDETADAGDFQLCQLGSIRGRVVDDDGATGVPGAKVELHTAFAAEDVAAVFTDLQGRFEFAGLPHPLYTLICPDNGTAYRRVELKDSPAAEVLFSVGGARLDGVVVRGGVPVSDVQVHAIRAKGREDESGFPASVTDSDGKYSFEGLPAGDWVISAVPRAPSLSRLSASLGISVRADPTTGVVIALPSGTLEARVSLDGDAPLPAGAVARAVPDSRADGVLPVAAVEAPVSGDGALQIRDLSPGRYTVAAWVPGVGCSLPAVVDVPFDGASNLAQIRLGNQGRATLRSVAVDYRDGTPLTSAWCLVRGQGGVLVHQALRDARGVLEVSGIPAGDYELEVSAYGYSVGTHKLHLESGGTASVEDVLYEAGAVRWQVSSANGATVSGAKCYLVPDDPTSIEKPREGFTDSSGCWTARGVHPGDYALTVDTGGTLQTCLITIDAHELEEGVTAVASRPPPRAPLPASQLAQNTR